MDKKQVASSDVDRLSLSRRDFLKLTMGLSVSAAGMTLLEACGSKPISEADTLETTTIRIPQAAAVSICVAPQYVAGDLLKAEGFPDVRYPRSTTHNRHR